MQTIGLKHNVVLTAWEKTPMGVLHTTTSSAHNITTNVGLTLASDRFYQGLIDPVSYIAIGTDDEAFMVGSTTLGNEVFRGAFTGTDRSAAGIITLVLFLGTATANGNTIREAGLFNAAAGGDMAAAVTFGVQGQVEKTSSKTVQVTWTVALSNP